MTLTSTGETLKARLRERAFALGVHAFGVCDAAPDTLTYTRLAESVERGDVSTWGYDIAWAQHAADPTQALPAARSSICVAVAYGHPAPVLRLGQGRVSNYAWGTADYHVHVQAILEQLVQLLQEMAPDDGALTICDTRPLAERALAMRAGLGWIGKHTNLIIPQVGSYVFLGEILTTYALPSDVPLRKQCGSCRRCITICPTAALRGDYTLDARRCISDLTQRRGMIPRALRPLMGTWIWGCDLCQAICPPTSKAAVKAAPAFAPLNDAYPDLLHLLKLDQQTFRARYQQSAMGWRGATLLRRNAAIALGNTQDRATVQALVEQFTLEQSPIVRGHIAWALGRIGSPLATQSLERALRLESHSTVRHELIAARSFA